MEGLFCGWSKGNLLRILHCTILSSKEFGYVDITIPTDALQQNAFHCEDIYLPS